MMEKDRIKKMVAKSRVPVTRIFGLVMVLLLIFTGHSFENKALIDILLELSGLFLLTLCSFGRIWALMYISGHKSRQVITDGPYSMVCHPCLLYTSDAADE